MPDAPGVGLPRDATRAAGVTVRPLDRARDDEVALVARRMHLTLVEVLGEEQARATYDDAWLVARVRWHLEGAEGAGAEVFLAEDADGAVLGHTIVRVEREEPPGAGASGAAAADGAVLRVFGLFSTTYVDPAARRRGVADVLLAAGEAWMAARGLSEARTYTADRNEKLHSLYARRGYALTELAGEWVQLSRAL